MARRKYELKSYLGNRKSEAVKEARMKREKDEEKSKNK
jgi:hypothetical protein